MEHANCVSCESEHTTPTGKKDKFTRDSGEKITLHQWECLDCGVKWSE